MKTIVSTFITILLCVQCKSQDSTTIIDTCRALQQYEGEWMYANETDTIRVFLRYHRNYSGNMNHLSDDVFGWHEYKKGSRVVESNYQFRFMQLPFNYDSDSLSINKFSIMLNLGGCNTTALKLWGTITDYQQGNETHNVTAMLNSAGTTMTWKQEYREGFGLGTGATGMTLPKQFVLVKQ